MPKSRSKKTKRKTRMLFCPGCGLRCWAGPERLARHIANQCSGSKAKGGVRTH